MIKIFFKIIITIYFFMASALAENIKDVEISGNKRISKDTIIVLGKIKITENYDTDRLNNVLKNLYNTNFFNNIGGKLLSLIIHTLFTPGKLFFIKIPVLFKISFPI